MGNGEVIFRVGARRSGKTTAILKWLQEAMKDEDKKVVVISGNRAMSDNLYYRAKSEGLDVTKDQFITVDQAARGALRGANSRIAVEEGQYILQQLCGFSLEYVTATGVREDD